MSERRRPKHPALVEADAALHGLLENLLAEVEPHQQEIPAVEEKTVLKQLFEEAVELKKEEVEPTTELMQEVEVETLAPEAPEVPVQPQWLEKEFVAILFEISGTKFAIPLVSLDSIAPYPEDVAAIPAQPSWHLGVAMNRGRQLMLVDLHRLLKLQPPANDETVGKGYLLVIGEGRYGLHCDTLGEPVKISEERVRWSDKRGGQPWLAGMLSDHMCGLLSPEGVLGQLQLG